MTDRLEKDIARGKRAEILLQDELLNEGLETIQSDLVKIWANASDPAERERVWQAYQIAGKFKSFLFNALNGGTMAQQDLNYLTGQSARGE